MESSCCHSFPDQLYLILPFRDALTVCLAVSLTSTIPWLMVPYCLFLSITKLMTITVAMATAITRRPMRALLLKLKSSCRELSFSCNEKRDDVEGVRGPETNTNHELQETTFPWPSAEVSMRCN